MAADSEQVLASSSCTVEDVKAQRRADKKTEQEEIEQTSPQVDIRSRTQCLMILRGRRTVQFTSLLLPLLLREQQGEAKIIRKKRHPCIKMGLQMERMKMSRAPLSKVLESRSSFHY